MTAWPRRSGRTARSPASRAGWWTAAVAALFGLFPSFRRDQIVRPPHQPAGVGATGSSTRAAEQRDLLQASTHHARVVVPLAWSPFDRARIGRLALISAFACARRASIRRRCARRCLGTRACLAALPSSRCRVLAGAHRALALSSGLRENMMAARIHRPVDRHLGRWKFKAAPVARGVVRRRRGAVRAAGQRHGCLPSAARAAVVVTLLFFAGWRAGAAPKRWLTFPERSAPEASGSVPTCVAQFQPLPMSEFCGKPLAKACLRYMGPPRFGRWTRVPRERSAGACGHRRGPGVRCDSCTPDLRRHRSSEKFDQRPNPRRSQTSTRVIVVVGRVGFLPASARRWLHFSGIDCRRFFVIGEKRVRRGLAVIADGRSRGARHRLRAEDT